MLLPDFSPQLLIRSMDTAVTETLETMFFSDSMPAASAELFGETVRSVVRFSGDASGEMELALADKHARLLTANFLGIDDAEVDMKQMESVCGEMANMICGAVVSNTAPDGRFDLSHPEVTAVSGPFHSHPVCRNYLTDTGSMTVSFQIARWN